MQPEKPRLRIVPLLEPNLCLSCRFATMVTVEKEDGSSQHMLHCKRLDCDNWQMSESEPISHYFIDGS